jgi:hypothetical protein
MLTATAPANAAVAVAAQVRQLKPMFYNLLKTR